MLRMLNGRAICISLRKVKLKPVDDWQHFLDSNQRHRLVELSSFELCLKHKQKTEQRDQKIPKLLQYIFLNKGKFVLREKMTEQGQKARKAIKATKLGTRTIVV